MKNLKDVRKNDFVRVTADWLPDTPAPGIVTEVRGSFAKVLLPSGLLYMVLPDEFEVIASFPAEVQEVQDAG